MGSRHQHSPARPKVHSQRTEDRKPVVLRQEGPEGSGRGPHQRRLLAAEHTLNVRSGATGPIYGVLEHARDAIVVFGRRQQQPVGPGDLFLELVDGYWIAMLVSHTI